MEKVQKLMIGQYELSVLSVNDKDGKRSSLDELGIHLQEGGFQKQDCSVEEDLALNDGVYSFVSPDFDSKFKIGAHKQPHQWRVCVENGVIISIHLTTDYGDVQIPATEASQLKIKKLMVDTLTAQSNIFYGEVKYAKIDLESSGIHLSHADFGTALGMRQMTGKRYAPPTEIYYLNPNTGEIEGNDYEPDAKEHARFN